MIKIYINRSNKSTKKAITWLDDHCLDYEIIKIKNLTVENFLHMLSLSEHGFEDFIISSSRGIELGGHFNYNFVTTRQMIDYLIENQYYLKSPIMYDDKRLVIGWSEEGIRVFLPRMKFNYRGKYGI